MKTLPGIEKYPDLHRSLLTELKSKGTCCGKRATILRKYKKLLNAREQADNEGSGDQG